MIYYMQSVHWFYSAFFSSLCCCVLSSSSSFFFLLLHNECTQTNSNYALRNVNLVLNYAIHTNHTLKHFLIRCALQKDFFFLFHSLAIHFTVWFSGVCVCVWVWFFLFIIVLTTYFVFSWILWKHQGKNGRISNKNRTISKFSLTLFNVTTLFE